MDNVNLWHIRGQIFDDLSHEDALNCRRVCKYWNESLKRLSDVKFIQEFGDRDIEHVQKQWELEKENKVSTIIPEWKNTAQKYGLQASIEDLEEVKNSLKKLARINGKCCAYTVHEAAKNGDVKLMEFIIRTSYDMNTEDGGGCTAFHKACCYGQTETAQIIIQSSKDFGIDLNNAKNGLGWKALHMACGFGQTEIVQLIIQSSKDFGFDLNAKDNFGNTALHWACSTGKTETAQLICQSSKDFGIDLNAKDKYGKTAFHEACFRGKTEIVEIIIKNWKEFGIDIKAQNNEGKIALDLINNKEGEEYDQIKKMLENEYSQIDVTEPVQEN